MATPTTSGGINWGGFFSGASSLYADTLKFKTAQETAKAATATADSNKTLLEAQINAQNSSKQIDQKTILLAAGAGVLLIGAIVALK